MWRPKFVRLLFMAALLSTQVIAGDKKVPRPLDLGLYIPLEAENGWKEIKTSGGFYAKVFVCPDPQYIEVASVQNRIATFKSYEALLSIWEHQSRLPARNLEKIKYDCVLGDDMVIINRALEILGHDISSAETIYGIEISRDSSDHAEIWNLLSTASFAKDAVEMCAEFQDMSNRYLQSFEIGRYYDSDKWVHIKFATKTE
ncbi:hypothetical protein HOO65_050012 [Ceratocystis lukuohia]|uniref:Uncharacterized protein n=1 Tax=Ceratocystis lukuohia TaxID=2019550 RepID=A0ABR4MF32_9PEZI